ncbi:molybdopterin-guanine dinucleotide biosynthesis protein B [Methanobrevibacter olleyae]|nr:molybdopterin-guanine dinucleotide biosynthesis protein B [Methanobrevibacter olleyae]SFL27460.1 molybdopterin-guanine dinucleotide biosynthesis protein B [Methanobrevibacter olleyae]
MRIISIVGLKNTGKTSLTSKIIKELTNRDFKVASIKHSHHQMEMDHEGTDTYKQMESGSDFVVGVGGRTYFNINERLDLERILFLIKLIENPDFVVIEGFKSYPYAKIATCEEAEDEYTISTVNSFEITDDELLDLVDLIEKRSYDILETLFVDECGYNDAKIIGQAFANGKLDYNPETQAELNLAIDGINIGLNKFVSNYIKQVILGIINPLKTDEYGVKDYNNIDITIKNKKD